MCSPASARASGKKKCKIPPFFCKIPIQIPPNPVLTASGEGALEMVVFLPTVEGGKLRP